MRKLSPLMEKAIKEAFPDGTIQGATVRTELALIRRGLAVGIYADEKRPNRYGNGTRTFLNAYQGAKLVKA